MQHAETMKKYIIVVYFPPFFYEFTLIHNCFLLIPDTLVFIVTAQWNEKKKNHDFVFNI